MRIAFSVLTRVFGLFWLVFGMNGLFHFFPVPAPAAESAYFMEALERATYVMPLVYGLQVCVGLLLLLQCCVPLALLLAAPIVGNIVLYDLFLNPSGLAIGIVIAVIEVLLLWRNRAAFMPLLDLSSPA